MNKVLIALFGSVLLSACSMAQQDGVAITSTAKPSTYTQTNFYDLYDDIYGTEEQLAKEAAELQNLGKKAQPQQPVAQPQPTPTPAPAPTPTEVKKPVEEPKKEEVKPSDIDVSKTAFGAMGNYKVGNPYLIDGVSYYPHEDYTYSEIGMASWYGPDFHGGKTANGEVFDETKLTAAHRTLPMPSLVRVTNLENGISANIKINDRGPYARDRILDLSSASADVLGIKQKGTARVKVEILAEESRNLKELAIASQNTDIYAPDIQQNPVPHSVEPTPVAPVVTPVVAPVQPTPTETQPKVEAQPQPVSQPEVKDESEDKSVGDYFVQIGAYSTYDKAESMKNKLSHLGTVKIFKAVANGNTLYKVRLGEFMTSEEAEKAQRAVSEAGVTGSRVIIKSDGNFKWKM